MRPEVIIMDAKSVRGQKRRKFLERIRMGRIEVSEEGLKAFNQSEMVKIMREKFRSEY